MKTALTGPDYAAFLTEVKGRIAAAHLSAARAVNRELILLYWDIGRAIVEKQQQLGWGESVIDRLSQDLHAAFPGASGFSPRNLRSMRQLYVAYSDSSQFGCSLQPNCQGPPRWAGSRFGCNLQPNWTTNDSTSNLCNGLCRN